MNATTSKITGTGGLFIRTKNLQKIKKERILLQFLLLLFFIPVHSPGQELKPGSKSLTGTSIEDFLLERLNENRVLVIPECLSHDSYDAIQLPVRLIKRWQETDNPNRLFLGLEHDDLNKNLKLVQAGEYYKVERFATICPGAWGLFSTRRLNEYLFYNGIINSRPGGFNIFGFENSYHFYDEKSGKYVLPSQVDIFNDSLKKIPNLESSAPMVIKYAYSRFFRDYLSFKSIEREINNNPDAFFIIVVGNAHTLKKWSFNETDYQIIDAYNIDTTKYARTLGYYLKKKYSSVFIQSGIDSLVVEPVLTTGEDSKIDAESYSAFYSDYFYLIPDAEDVNMEEPPLLAIPSASNLELLRDKNFQYYPDDEFEAIAQNLVYLFTGIRPEIEVDNQGQVGSCTFINPDTKTPVNFDVYRDSVVTWYRDGTFMRRIMENPAAYNHRSLFKGIFRSMHKDQLETFTVAGQNEFLKYLYAALSVIGNAQEREYARSKLISELGASEDYYYYFKKVYSGRYQ